MVGRVSTDLKFPSLGGVRRSRGEGFRFILYHLTPPRPAGPPLRWRGIKKSPKGDFFYFLRGNLTAACAAAKRAIGTRNGEQDTELNPTWWKN